MLTVSVRINLWIRFFFLVQKKEETFNRFENILVDDMRFIGLRADHIFSEIYRNLNFNKNEMSLPIYI